MGRRSPLVRACALLFTALAVACNETVYQVVPAADITISSSPTDMEPGQVVQLTAQVVGADGRVLAGRTITWSSNADAVAAVDATGRITARMPGSVTIIASSEGKSAQRSYTVRSAVPTITALSPPTALPNTAFALTVQGTGFYNGSTVRWNGANRPTTFVSATELRAAIPATDLGVHGPVAVTVLNAAPGGGTSNAATLVVRPTDACQYLPPYTLGVTANGRIEATDCRLGDGSFADVFGFPVGTPQILTLRMNSAQVDPYLILTSAAENRTFAYNDDSGGSLNSTLTVVIAPGSYRVYATTQPASQFGDYALTSEAGPNAVSGCAEVWMMTGLFVNQSLAATDCRTAAGTQNYYGDRYHIYLTAGQTIQMDMTSTEVNSWVSVLQPGTLDVLAEDDNSGGGNNSRLAFTAATEGVYIIEASTFTTGEVGAYRLEVRQP